jgi:sterol desaturase/sphingolipid hydroxylase (fatty acid hydroxylase superfamily)
LQNYLKIIAEAYGGYAQYLFTEVLNPNWHNYFYWVIGVSLLIWLAEILFPWRKNQPIIREHFGLDIFYIFWNYFLFSLVAYNALSMVGVQLFKDFLGLFEVENLVAISVENWPHWLQLLFIFVFRDLMQWRIHKLLHQVNWMWEFHKVHHSTRMMGFGALMRYHFMENIIYRSLEYIPLAMIGFGISDFFLVHIATFVIGQLGHANLYIPLGPLKYILNGPQMHLWHHAKKYPKSHPIGFNFGISLSVWDYLFGTNYWPKTDENLEIGVPEEENFPENFKEQITLPFKKIFGKSN